MKSIYTKKNFNKRINLNTNSITTQSKMDPTHRFEVEERVLMILLETREQCLQRLIAVKENDTDEYLRNKADGELRLLQ